MTGETRDAARRPACSSPSATTRAPSCSRGQVDLDDDGYVLVEHPSTAHQPPRRLRLPATWSTTPTARPITAAGTGCAAALDAERYLAALDHAASTAGAASRARASVDAGSEPRAGEHPPTTC